MIDQAETERLFQNIIDVCGRRLSIADVMEVNSWIAQHEYGIALETLVDILCDAPVTTAIAQSIEVLASLMEMLDIMTDLVVEEI